ncbi:MAG: hypothetical protein WBH36_02940, partial [Syntrophobacteria bacterium]
VWFIEYWNLRFICDLVLEIWSFGMWIEKCELMIEFLSTTDSWRLTPQTQRHALSTVAGRV